MAMPSDDLLKRSKSVRIIPTIFLLVGCSFASDSNYMVSPFSKIPIKAVLADRD